MSSKCAAILLGCGCAAFASADVVTMRFQGRIFQTLDDLNGFTFPDTQQNLWGRIIVDTEAPGTQYFPNGTFYELLGVEVYIGGQSFIADAERRLTIINDNAEPGVEDVFRFDGFVSIVPGDHWHIESMTFGDAHWLSSQAIPALDQIQADHPAVNGAWINLERGAPGGDRSYVVASITRWEVVPGPATASIMLTASLAIASRRRRGV